MEDLLGGEYRSVFKGTGIAFEEVREYQPGDDVRAIDWNVTARMGHPFIKRFVEERELTIMLLVDCSGSQRFGTQQRQKPEVAAEIAAVLAYSAIVNNDRVGLIAFTDQIERFVPPRKGTATSSASFAISCSTNRNTPWDLDRAALDFLNRVLRRRAIIFLLSDFFDRDFERALEYAGRRHDLIAILLSDPREGELPAVGLLELEDAESGSRFVLDTNSRPVREAYADSARNRLQLLRQLFRSTRVDLIEATTQGNHLDVLIRFFRLRSAACGESDVLLSMKTPLFALFLSLLAGAAPGPMPYAYPIEQREDATFLLGNKVYHRAGLILRPACWLCPCPANSSTPSRQRGLPDLTWICLIL